MTVKQQEERDELMDMLPDLPNDWEEWIESTFTPTPIFYRNEGHGIYSCTCGKCGEEYALYTRKENDFEIPAEKPVKGKEAVCMFCRNIGTYMQKKMYSNTPRRPRGGNLSKGRRHADKQNFLHAQNCASGQRAEYKNHGGNKNLLHAGAGETIRI